MFTYCHIYGLLGLPIVLLLIGLCVHFTHHVHIELWVHSAYLLNILHNIIILSLVNLESLLRYEVLFKLDTPITKQFISPHRFKGITLMRLWRRLVLFRIQEPRTEPFAFGRDSIQRDNQMKQPGRG